jgi:spore coat protein SA
MAGSGDLMLPKEKRYGAIEAYAYGLCKELSRTNLVDVFSYGEGEERAKNLHIRTFTCKPSVINAMTPLLSNYLKLQTLYFDAYMLKDVLRAHKANSLDIIHVHNTIPAPIIPFCKFALKTPVVCSVHSYYRPVVLLQRFDKLLPVSEHMKQYLCVEKGISPKKVDVLRLAVDLNEWSPNVDSEKAKNMLGLQGRKIILFVGRKCPEKGPEVLVEALHLLVKRNPEVVAVFIGADYYHDSIKTSYTDFLVSKTKNLEIENNAIFKSWIPENVLKLYYNAADAFVIPSIWQEPLCKVVLESLACEKPVVATRVGGIPEMISHGRDGLLVPPGDPDALAEAVSLVLNDSEFANSLGRAGRETVKKRFSFEVVADKCLKIYNSLVS